MSLPKRLRVKAAAQYLGISDKMIRALAESGAVPAADMRSDGAHYACWVFDTRDLDAYRSSRMNQGPAA